MSFSVVSLVGICFLAYLLLQFAMWAYRTFFYRSNFAAYCPKSTWAVVTGCTDGIGKGFVLELAKKAKLNIVLVSRSEQKLKELKEEIENNYSVQTKTVAIDFSATTDYSALSKAIEGLDVSCLINNVGVNSEVPTKFLELTDKEIHDMVQVNISATLAVTRIVMPKIVDAKRGAIVNLSSYTGVLPTPLLGVYSATKAFNDAWSKTLKAEYGTSKIEILSVTPFYVVSSMSGFKKASLTVCTATRLAGDVIKAVGGAPSSISGYYVHSIMQYVIGLLPEFVYNMISSGQMNSVRKHLLKKKAAAAAEAK